MDDRETDCELLPCPCCVRAEEDKAALRAEVGRLALAEALIAASEALDDFDCPHYPEERCKCGDVAMQLRKKWWLAKMAYDKVKPSPRSSGGGR